MTTNTIHRMMPVYYVVNQPRGYVTTWTPLMHHVNSTVVHSRVFVTPYVAIRPHNTANSVLFGNIVPYQTPRAPNNVIPTASCNDVAITAKKELFGNIVPCQTPREPNSVIPADWYDIEPTAMPQRNSDDVNAVIKLIESNKGLVQDGNFLIFHEGQRFPNACLHAYKEDRISLTQLVSSIMLFCALREFGINAENASLVQRIPLTGAKDEQFPLAPNAQGDEGHYYHIKIPCYDKIPEGTENLFVGEVYIPYAFSIQKKCTPHLESFISIPSFSSMQAFLNVQYSSAAVRLIPRWGNTSKHEIFQQAGTRTRVLGLDPENKNKPHDSILGPYGEILHDFYHANLISNIPLSHQHAFKNVALGLLKEAANVQITQDDIAMAREEAKQRPKPWVDNKTPLDPKTSDKQLRAELAAALINILQLNAWEALDMDVGGYRKHPSVNNHELAMDHFTWAIQEISEGTRLPLPKYDYPWYFGKVLDRRLSNAVEKHSVVSERYIHQNRPLDKV